MKRAWVKYSLISATIFLLIGTATAEENKEGVGDHGNASKENYFRSINRFQYRMAINGESGFSQGSFVILPHGFTLAELIEVLTEPGDDSRLNYANFDLEVKLARYMDPGSDWGKALSWVVRGQCASRIPFTTGAGLQWNITETPGVPAGTADYPWKSLVQVFVKSRDQFGLVDIYHWYQFPLLKKNRLYLRGANAVYFLDDSKIFVSAMQDVIFPVTTKLEVFARHLYQNQELFGHQRGSQFGIGVRIAF